MKRGQKIAIFFLADAILRYRAISQSQGARRTMQSTPPKARIAPIVRSLWPPLFDATQESWVIFETVFERCTASCCSVLWRSSRHFHRPLSSVRQSPSVSGAHAIGCISTLHALFVRAIREQRAAWSPYPRNPVDPDRNDIADQKVLAGHA